MFPREEVHDCKTHGVAIYGDLLGEFGGGVVEGCEIANNGQDGVLLRGGARGDVVNNVVSDNGRFGRLARADIRLTHNLKGVCGFNS